jgi:hypothetical protein
MYMPVRILERERTAILSSLAAGVVPRIGLQHIQVGRSGEVKALLDDLGRIENGASAIRFVVGRFGAGKSFFLNLMQTVALERKIVVVRADITTDCRLYATAGQARSLYAALMQSLSTRSRPEGGALGNLVERWIGDIAHVVETAGGGQSDVEKKLAEFCMPLQDLVSGYDFAEVMSQYYRGHLQGNDALRSAALRWLRGEYSTKTEARQALGVRSIIDDNSFYDYLKLFAAFVRIAGYAGLLVCLDELVVLSDRLNNRAARENNYEAILRILNDCLQGNVQGIGFLFAATDECMFNNRRGLFSYEALASRLAANRFAGDGMVDFSGPLLNLPNLTQEECYVLLCKLRAVHSGGDESKNLLPDEGIEAYLKSCQQRMGSAYFQTPRDTVKDFIGLLAVLQQNPSADWRSLIGEIKTTAPVSDAAEAPIEDADDDLASFKV